MTKMRTGVYSITNTKNGKRYIGSSSQRLSKRIWSHKKSLKLGNHYNQHLQSAWNMYGKEFFEFSIIEYCEPQLCVRREQFWIDLFKTYNRKYGYNKSAVAGSPLGYKHTEEARARMSASKIGKKKSPETIARMKAAKRNMSEETKAKMSRSARNRSPEHKEKLMIAMLGNQNGRRSAR